MRTDQFKVKNVLTGNVYRCVMEDENTYFVLAPHKRKRGYRYTASEFENHFQILKDKISPTEKWHKSISKAIKKIRRSGLWTIHLDFFENLLLMTYEDHEDMCNHWSDKQYLYDTYYDKYPFAFDDNQKIKYDYISEFSQCQLKSMYFGHQNAAIKEYIKHHIATKTSCTQRAIANYDVTFEYNAEKGIAWYSEEYRNCGNGHYYLALDENTAIFYEND